MKYETSNSNMTPVVTLELEQMLSYKPWDTVSCTCSGIWVFRIAKLFLGNIHANLVESVVLVGWNTNTKLLPYVQSALLSSIYTEIYGKQIGSDLNSGHCC
jgi:hypothetical protein